MAPTDKSVLVTNALAFGAVPHNIVEEQLIKDWLGPTGIVVDLRESKEYGEHEVSDWPNFIHYPITDLNKPSDMHSFHTLIKDTVLFSLSRRTWSFRFNDGLYIVVYEIHISTENSS